MRAFVLMVAVFSMVALLGAGCKEEPSASTGGNTADPHAGHDHGAHDHSDHSGHADHDAKQMADKGGTMTSEATALLEAVTKHINENKMDLADEAMAKLEKMKADLPDSLNKKIEAARSALDTAKAASGGVDMPKLPKLGE